MKYKMALGLGAVLLFSSATAQTAAPDGMYVDYMQYFGVVAKTFSVPGGPVPKPLKELEDSAATLKDEAAPLNGVPVLKRGTSVMSDEDIYAGRKESVFIVGKLSKRKKDAQGASFDLTGAAFAISADGICVTNYHVLSDIIHGNGVAGGMDSAYFIMTSDEKVFFIDQILAYSQNNDLVIFRVFLNGQTLRPLPLGRPASVGGTTFCISHPGGYFYYYSKGIVARNVTVAGQETAVGYNPGGRSPIRMEVSAEYGVGSSGAPLFDKYGNLAGVVSSTATLGADIQKADGSKMYHQQVVIRDAIPVTALIDLLGSKML